MKKLFIKLFLLNVAVIGIASLTFAGKKCSLLCGDTVHNADSPIGADGHECSEGHAICLDCLTSQVESENHLERLRNEGLPCVQRGCQQVIPFETISVLLPPLARLALEARQL